VKTILISSAIAICVVLSTVRGFAQQVSATKALEDRFKVLDKNGDGRITRDELPQSPFFEQRDKNGDGVITLAEAKEFLEASANLSSTPSDKEPVPTNQPARDKSPPSTPQRVQPQKGGDYGVGRMVEDLPRWTGRSTSSARWRSNALSLSP
jgi:hypothetical protein